MDKKVKEIIDTLDPDKFQCFQCRRWLLLKDLNEITSKPFGEVAAYRCKDESGCRYMEDVRKHNWLLQWRKTFREKFC